MTQDADATQTAAGRNVHVGDLAGVGLTGNSEVTITDSETLSADWGVLRALTFEHRHANGTTSVQRREVYDRGNGATVLLYDAERATVLLTRQFRLPVYVNGHSDGMLLETAAGLLDEDAPEDAIRREAEEETGRVIGDIEHVFDVYMSPGSVTEKLHFYAAEYLGAGDPTLHAGVLAEGEDIEVIELVFSDALALIGIGIVDAKTIMLLQWAALKGPFSG
ncbi:MAG: hypothetical protein JWQ43_2311 [Glaciihabitans sp.]|nr:hypothetical protein [Glaciihabitans sp.]